MREQRTAMSDLTEALCHNKESRIFPNQVAMYQILIVIAGDGIDGTDGASSAGVDSLVLRIREYLECLYKKLQTGNNEKDDAAFTDLHEQIYSGISQNLAKLPSPDLPGDTRLLAADRLFGESAAAKASNISNIIANKHGKKLPRSWYRLLDESQNNYEIFIKRMFWVLQYYLAYYCRSSHEFCAININADDYRREYGCVEYFSLAPAKRACLAKALQENCSRYSKTAELCSPITLNLYMLARIVLDAIIEQINSSMNANLGKLDVFDDVVSKSTTAELKQYNQYRNQIDCYGAETLERIRMLEKYAKQNCYAADELGTVYYFGKAVTIGADSYYIERDYQKAIELYKMAIRNSNPPLPSSCWSLGQAIERICESLHAATAEGIQRRMETALRYYEMAGEYPPAYGSRAKAAISHGERLYKKYQLNPERELWIQLIDTLVDGLELAGKASDMGWFFSNNVIALFLLHHSEDTELVTAIREKAQLTVPLDIEAQFKIGSDIGNPWTMNALAKYYIGQGRTSEAKGLLKKCMAVNYRTSFYTVATRLYDQSTEDGKRERKRYLAMASDRQYPRATFELALDAIADQNREEAKRFLNLAKQQALSLRKVDYDLLKQINRQLEGLSIQE